MINELLGVPIAPKNYLCTKSEDLENPTLLAFDAILADCQSLFAKKTQDYGTAWRILRPSSLTDQLFIKAKRIRSIQEKGVQKVDEPINDEFVGIINYSLLGLIQLTLTGNDPLEIEPQRATELYQKEAAETRRLLANKNHDYGEAWREMRVSSITDLILMKLLRIKQIEDAGGKTMVSEGIDAGYRDIINYAVFALILLSEDQQTLPSN